jgi:purine-binding chemotaxis protein CheW
VSLYSNFSEQEWQILQARAARVAAASAQQGDYRTDVMAALRVTVRGERYALPLDSITAVYDRTPIIPVPCTPPFVAGIANIRGHIIPVLDLAALLGIADGNTPGAAALVLAE